MVFPAGKGAWETEKLCGLFLFSSEGTWALLSEMVIDGKTTLITVDPNFPVWNWKCSSLPESQMIVPTSQKNICHLMGQ